MNINITPMNINITPMNINITPMNINITPLNCCLLWLQFGFLLADDFQGSAHDQLCVHL